MQLIRQKFALSNHVPRKVGKKPAYISRPDYENDIKYVEPISGYLTWHPDAPILDSLRSYFPPFSSSQNKLQYCHLSL